MPDLPPRLYKYREFGVNALKILTAAEVFFAQPKIFNDPLDGKPVLVPDLNWRETEALWWRLSEEEILDVKKRTAAHSAIRQRTLDECRHIASENGGFWNDDGGGSQIYAIEICRLIEQWLYQELAPYGVLALASRWDCPLMWSHYGAQHHGLCFEFDTTRPPPKSYDVRRVRYGLARTIPLSHIARWKEKSIFEDKRAILDTYFVAKAPAWKYEDEFRVIHPRSGTHQTPFRVRAVYFGMRCDHAIKAAVVNLAREYDQIEFYSIDVGSSGFELCRNDYSAEEEWALGSVRRAAWEDFDDLTAAEGGDPVGVE